VAHVTVLGVGRKLKFGWLIKHGVTKDIGEQSLTTSVLHGSEYVQVHAPGGFTPRLRASNARLMGVKCSVYTIITNLMH